MSLYTKIIDRQKLKEAWSRVKRNHPAAGTDNITCDEFEAGLRENIQQLHADLENHSYQSQPVKTAFLYKGEKKRTISLFSMRDKTVHLAVSNELIRLYDPRMSSSVYAYRPGRAALQAINKLEHLLKINPEQWILKTDIKDFFDSVPLEKLYLLLSQNIKEKEVLDLISCCCEAKELKKDGTLLSRKTGLYQGSGLSPVLSNIYLMDFDHALEQRCRTYIRYSDDMLILGDTQEQLESLKNFIKEALETLGLKINEEKTIICPARNGLSFLGYQLSEKGLAIPAKAEENLQSRLEQIWLSSDPTDQKLQKSSEVLTGWEQYYRKERSIGSIEEFTTVLYMVRNKAPEIFASIKEQRKNHKNTNKNICQYLVSVWAEDWSLVLFEYEQYFDLEEQDPEISLTDPKPCCNLFQKLLNNETEENWTELMQLYSDCNAFNKASWILNRITMLQENRSVISLPDILPVRVSKEVSFEPDAAFLQQFLQTFAGREDTYGREELDARTKRMVEQIPEPLTEDVIRNHLKGTCTVSTYIQRPNLTAKYLVIDIDISKKALLQEGMEQALAFYLPQAAQSAAELLKTLAHLGLKGYLEYSGFRGYHVWIFFTEWIPTRYIHMLTDIIHEQWNPSSPEISVEYFPNKSRIRNDSPGQSLKLPYGIHLRTGKRSMLLTDDFQELSPEELKLNDLAQFSLQAIKRIIGTNTQDASLTELKEVEQNLEGFGELSENIRIVLQRCNLMRYLCQKAKNTGYLTHFERLSILYVFGHLGEDGKQFVHTIMGFTLNYQYAVTDRFINRIPAKPISCLKLREQYKQITAEFGCSCNFRRTKNCYPSPVLHAIKSSGDVSDDVTIPTSRSVSKEKEKEVVEELNIHIKVQELASRIIDMKKQKRRIDKSIQKTESELEKIYDQAGIDCLEVEMGLLSRRKKEEGYEWLIEI